MSNETKANIINALLFQGCWFLAILTEWVYALPALVVLLAHNLYLHRELAVPLKLLGIAVTGIVIDSVFMALDVFRFDVSSATLASGVVPLWLCILWLGFVFTLNQSLAWMISRPVVCVGLCAIAGPLSYAAGRRFDAIYFDNSALFYIAVEWVLIAGISLFLLSVQHENSSSKMANGYV